MYFITFNLLTIVSSSIRARIIRIFYFNKRSRCRHIKYKLLCRGIPFLILFRICKMSQKSEGEPMNVNKGQKMQKEPRTDTKRLEDAKRPGRTKELQKCPRKDKKGAQTAKRSQLVVRRCKRSLGLPKRVKKGREDAR